MMFTCRVGQGDRTKYLDEAVRVNHKLLFVTSLFCIGVEALNVCRVLFWSKSGIETLNNRIYLSFYVALLLCSVAYLAADRLSKGTPEKKNRLCLAYASTVLLWCTLFNVYDSYRTGETRLLSLNTVLIVFGVMMVMEYPYAFLNIWGNYLLFMVLMPLSPWKGEGFNFTIGVLTVTMIFMFRFHHFCIELNQSRQLQEYDEKIKGAFWLTQEQFQLVSRSIGLITFRWNVKDSSVVFSENWGEVFGLPCNIKNLEKFIRQNPMIDQEQKELLFNGAEKARIHTDYQTLELRLPVKNGDMRWFRVQAAMERGADASYAVGFMKDITDEREKFIYLERHAKMDPFTGLLNKAAIDAFGRKKLESLSKDDRRLAMVIFDMDDFKDINDTFGHPCGDYVLKTVAEIIRKNAPKEAMVGRLGGDEFIAVIEAGEDKGTITRFAQKVIQEVSGIQCDGMDVHAKCSIGFAVTNSSDWTYERLYRYADEALYMAKEKGKNQVCEYEGKRTGRLT